MNNRQLQIFIILANTLNFRKTAEQMYLSQTTVSFQIHTLEDELGVKLFNRNTRTVTLTEAGELFYDYAKKSLEELNAGIEQISIYKKGYFEMLQVGIAVDTNAIGLSEIITEFRNSHPKVDVSYQPGYPRNLLEELRSDQYNIVIVPYSEILRSDDLSILKLGTYKTILAFHKTHPFSEKEDLTWKDFQGEKYLYVSDDQNELDFSLEFLAKCRKHRVEPEIIMKTDNIDKILLMLETGFGFTVIPSYFAKRLGSNSHIKTLDADLDLKGTTLYAVWKSGTKDKNITAFTTLLKNKLLSS